MPWGEPVSFKPLGAEKFFVVENTAAAADFLIENWPYEARGNEYWRAVENCLADLQGKPSKARACFIAAAKAAEISIWSSASST